MAPDPGVIAAIAASVETSPENIALRLHLTDLLVQAARHAEAVDHVAYALGQRPDDLDALRLAVLAHEGVGDTARAAGYRRLHDALAGPEATTAPPAVDEGGPDGGPGHRWTGAGSEAPHAQPPASPPPARAPSNTSAPDPDTVTPQVPAAPDLGEQPDLPPVPVTASGQRVEDEYDSFLREVLEAEGIDVEQPGITLDHVGGLADVKHQLQVSFLGPMRNPELRRTYGKSLRGGLLLYGPPGCGKTFLARAVAGELGARFLAVGLHDVLDMWLGASERNVHEVFETARRLAPCVLFLDEVDALGLKRSNLTQSAGRNVVVQLLTELDSTRDDNEGVFVLGATNQPWDLDPALRRPGRFDRTLLVLPPDAEARRAILAYHLEGRPVAPNVDLTALARKTDGCSGADLRLVCESAAELGIAASISSGEIEPITMRHLTAAAKQVKPSTRPWFETARNYATFANQDGAYDDLLAYMRKNRLG